MASTQFDIIRRQSEGAVQNEMNRATATVRRETSLVSQASRLAGRAVLEGEEALRRELHGRPARRNAPQNVVETAPPPVRPAADGYVRRSPVQPVYEAADYHRRLALRVVGTVLLAAAAGVAVFILSRLGLFGR